MERDATHEEHSRALERAQAAQPSLWFDRMVDEMLPTRAEQNLWLDRSLALCAADGGDLGLISGASPRLAREIQRSGGLASASRRPASTAAPAGKRPAWWLEPARPSKPRPLYPAQMRREQPTATSPTVKIKPDAYNAIVDACYDQDIEVGGGLFGRGGKGEPTTIVEATVDCSAQNATGVELDFDEIWRRGDEWSAGASAMRHRGDWHLHPGGGSRPSTKDVTAWLAVLDDANRDLTHLTHYIGLIIESDGRDQYGNYYGPRVNAWLVSRDEHGHAICERANVERLS
jgi:hypothetical protein